MTETAAAQPSAAPAANFERPPAKPWQFFWSMIRFSGWLYLSITIMRIFIFGLVPDLPP